MIWRGPVFMGLLFFNLWTALVLYSDAPLKTLLTAPLVGSVFGLMAQSYLVDVSLFRRALGWVGGVLIGLVAGLSYATWTLLPLSQGWFLGYCWGTVLGPLLLPHLELQRGHLSDRLQGLVFGTMGGLLVGSAWLASDHTLGWSGLCLVALCGAVVGVLVPSRGDLLNERSARMPGQALRGALVGGLVGLLLGALEVMALLHDHSRLTTMDVVGGLVALPLLLGLPAAVISILLDGTNPMVYLNRYHRGPRG